MKQVLLILLVIVAIIMIYLGANANPIVKPPIFTGVGFIIIAALFLDKSKKG